MCLRLLLLSSLFRVGDILRGTLRDVRHYFVKEMYCYLPFNDKVAKLKTRGILLYLHKSSLKGRLHHFSTSPHMIGPH